MTFSIKNVATNEAEASGMAMATTMNRFSDSVGIRGPTMSILTLSNKVLDESIVVESQADESAELTEISWD
ncbi:11496_t:CDS:2, partial [Racocetra fulgida]